MKKIAFAIIGISLLAAACNKSTTQAPLINNSTSQEQTQPPVQTPHTPSQTTNTPPDKSKGSTANQSVSEKITGQPFVDSMPNGLPANFSAEGTNNLRVSIVRSIQAQLSAYVNNDNPAQYTSNNTLYVKYPTKLSSVFGGGATPTDPVTKKTIAYTVASDGKDYTLCIEFQIGVKTCGNQNTNWSTYLIKQ